MSGLGKLWAGKVYGTNIGNLFIELDETEPQVVGTLRFLDQQAGVSVYRIEGKFDGHLLLTGKWQQGGEPEHHGVLTIEGRLTSEGFLRGTWKSTIGTGGTFNLYPHDLAIASPTTNADSTPEQVYSRNITIGAVKLYAEDVLNLLKYVQEEFTTPRPVITYHTRGSEVTKYAEAFVTEAPNLGKIDYLKIFVQEPDAHGINRLVAIELRAFGTNEIRVQGTRESWVVGRSETLAAFLKKHQSNIVTNYRKFGLNLNSIIFLAMLVAMPEIGTWQRRTAFVIATIALLVMLFWAHSKFIPNASFVMTETKPNAFTRAWPTILSWLVAASASLTAAFIFYWLTKNSLP